MNQESAIASRIESLRSSIRRTAEACGRRPEEISFILATKTVPPEKIEEAARAGVVDFGENRAQELLAKKKECPAGIRWHMIGRLQTNKVKQILGEVVLVHSLDRAGLAAEIESRARAENIFVDCLLQVNSSGESTKAGFRPEEVADFVGRLAPDSPVRVRGLMTIGPLTDDTEEIRAAFRSAKSLQRGLAEKFPARDFGILSMGMSGDYKIAIEEGATCLRIGTFVFGERIAQSA